MQIVIALILIIVFLPFIELLLTMLIGIAGLIFIGFIWALPGLIVGGILGLVFGNPPLFAILGGLISGMYLGFKDKV